MIEDVRASGHSQTESIINKLCYMYNEGYTLGYKVYLKL